MSTVSLLEAGRRDFLEALAGVSANAAAIKPSPDTWSILECIEHVIAVEERYVSWIVSGAQIEPRPDPDRELRLFTAARNRLSKLQTPDVYRPRGRFSSLSEAAAAFRETRDRTVRLAGESDRLYAVGVQHPYFGNINAVELIQLLDGHTRRHADQIRDIPSMPKVKNVRQPSRRSDNFKRDTPDLPSDFEIPEDPSRVFTNKTDEIFLQDFRLQEFGNSGLTLGSFRLSGCLFEKVVLSNATFGSAVWKDVRLVGCDLANIRAHRLVLTRVELIDCRITGLTATGVEWKDVLVQECDLRYAQLSGGAFNTCEFQRCDWSEADLQEADLSGCLLRACNLSRADLNRSRLHNADLRASDIESLQIGTVDVRGAIVDPTQAMVLARLLGVQIR